jgi:hypothetical protein
MTTQTRALLQQRAPYRTAQGRRIRTLFRSLLANHKAADPLRVALAITAAELTVAAEQARDLLLAGDLSAEQPTVRLENAARRAREDLKAILIAEETNKPWDPRSLWATMGGARDDDEENEAAAESN